MVGCYSGHRIESIVGSSCSAKMQYELSAKTFKSMKEKMDADTGRNPTCDWRGPAEAIP